MASKIITNLYGQNLDSAQPMQSSDLITEIVELDKELRSLELSLQVDLLPASSALGNIDQEPQHTRKGRMMITLRLLNIKILLHRPCLEKRLRERSEGSPYPQDFLGGVLTSSVESCTRAARDTILMTRNFVSIRHSGPQLLGPVFLVLHYGLTRNHRHFCLY